MKHPTEELPKEATTITHKSFSQLNMKQFPSFKVMFQYASLSFSSNPIDSWKTLPSLPFLKYLEMNNTKISSFQYAQKQPTIETINLKNTPISNYAHFQLMAIIAFGRTLKILNGSRIPLQIRRRGHELASSLYPYLFNSWIIINDRPLILFNTITRQRTKFMNGNIPQIEIEPVIFEDSAQILSNVANEPISLGSKTGNPSESTPKEQMRMPKRKSLDTPANNMTPQINDKLAKSMPRIPQFVNNKSKTPNRSDSHKPNTLIPRRNIPNKSKTPITKFTNQHRNTSSIQKGHSIQIEMSIDDKATATQNEQSIYESSKPLVTERTLVSTPRSIIKGENKINLSEIKKVIINNLSKDKLYPATNESTDIDNAGSALPTHENEISTIKEIVESKDETLKSSEENIEVDKTIDIIDESKEHLDNSFDNFEILSDVLSSSMSSSFDDFTPERTPIQIQAPHSHTKDLEGQPTLNEMFQNIIGNIPESDISSFAPSDATSVSDFISDAALDRQLDDLRSISSTDMSSDAFSGCENDFTYSNNYVPKRSQFRRNSRNNSPSKRRRRTYFVRDTNVNSILLD